MFYRQSMCQGASLVLTCAASSQARRPTVKTRHAIHCFSPLCQVLPEWWTGDHWLWLRPTTKWFLELLEALAFGRKGKKHLNPFIWVTVIPIQSPPPNVTSHHRRRVREESLPKHQKLASPAAHVTWKSSMDDVLAITDTYFWPSRQLWYRRRVL